MLFDSKELLCEALRVKLLAERCPCKYAFHIEAGEVRVAAAVDYRLARLAGMEDFWKLAPALRERVEALVPAEDEADGGYCEWGFACIRDGHGKTFAPGRVEVVPKGDFCAWLSPHELRDVVDHAQRERTARQGEADNVRKGYFTAGLHAANYIKKARREIHRLARREGK